VTQVHIDIRRPTASGVDEPFRLGMTWAPTAVRVVDDVLVMPEAFGVTLPYGPVVITVDPSELPDWVWRVRYVVNSEHFDRYLLVPDSPTMVEFTDLVEVDPATLLPTAEPEAAWWIALEEGGGVGLAAVQWRSLTPGDDQPLIIWKPSIEEPQESDGAEDGHLWLKRTVI
jgi:hypothetical protein